MFKPVAIPALGRNLSNIMAAPSSGHAETHLAGLDTYRALGGDSVHLHGEGGEEHSRRCTGEWLSARTARSEMLLCTQICHDGWDEINRREIGRFTRQAVHEDVATDLGLLGVEHLDLVYLDDHPGEDYSAVIDALADEISAGRLRAIGVRNWSSDRLRAAHSYARKTGLAGISAVFTTELALPAASEPLWPEYLPMDNALRQTVVDLGLAVFAHAGDLSSGQCLFGDEDPSARFRRRWIERWDARANAELVDRVRALAEARGVTPREICLAWTLFQPFPVIAIVGLPDLLGDRCGQYESASQLSLTAKERETLDQARAAAASLHSML